MGVDRTEASKEMGVCSTLFLGGSGLEDENLVRELFWTLKGIKSRVALMLSRQISQLQLASFLQPG